MQDYQGKTIIVTGGAGHIGRAITESYLAAGAHVVICGRRAPKDKITVDGNEAVFISVDIRDPEQSQMLVDETMKRFGRLDVLVNNAGGSPPVDAAQASPSLTEKIISLNLLAPLVLSQQAYQAMQQHEGVGNIVNIASVSGVRPSPGTTAYGAAKAGLLSATKSLAMEWGPQLRVNAIIVGLVHHDAGVEHYGGEEGFKKVGDMLPLKRMAHPQDIANACLYLSSDQASYVSGATLEVDGGGEVPVFLHLAAEANTSQ
jgi:NAD(P)-dependent dehydrogenase (short-subunit alcohol dehydrogenase family)